MFEYFKELNHFRKQIRGMFRDWTFDGALEIHYAHKDKYEIYFGGRPRFFVFCKDWIEGNNHSRPEVFLGTLNIVERYLVFREILNHLSKLEKQRQLERLEMKRKIKELESKITYKDRISSFLKKVTGFEIEVDAVYKDVNSPK